MLRVSAGVALIAIGVIGVVLPVIPGIPLLATGLALVGPDHPLVRWGRVRLARWFGRKGGHDDVARTMCADDARTKDSRPVTGP